jgi:hypothetical protein
MTDHHDPDELASAHLDGATTAEEAARVEADPALRAQVETMREVRAAIQSAVEADPDRRDAAIAAALAAFDDEGADGGPATATVTPLAPRRTLSPTARRVLGAAAVAALLALLVPLLANGGSDDAETADASFEETGSAIGDAEATTGDGGGVAAPSAGATSTTAARELRALGTYDDVDDLLDALGSDEAALFSEDGADRPQTVSPPRCDANQYRAASSLAVAVVAGQRVVVSLVPEDGGVRAVVVDADTCEVIAEREL